MTEHGTLGGHRRAGTRSGSFILDPRGTIVGFDSGMETLTGWSAVEVVGRNRDFRRVLGPAEDGRWRGAEPVLDFDALRRRDRSIPTILRLTCRDGSILDVEAAVHVTSGSKERISVEVLRVLARGHSGSPVGASTASDPLTGLPGHAAFALRLEEEVAVSSRNGRPLAVVLCDVDQLRKVGDTHGREAVDRVLRKLAGILRASVRDGDVVARLDEDDFALLLPGMGRGSARQVAARVRSTVERFRFLTPGPSANDTRVTVSLGAASYPADAENAGDLMQRAREALDEARALGRNRVWCYTRRPRVPVRAPVYLDGSEPTLLGFSTDLSPSGVFVTTSTPIDIGMRCALSFPLPTGEGHVHVIGRVVRAVPPQEAAEHGLPGMGIEFERFGEQDRRAIEAFLFENESTSRRPENGRFSVP